MMTRRQILALPFVAPLAAKVGLAPKPERPIAAPWLGYRYGSRESALEFIAEQARTGSRDFLGLVLSKNPILEILDSEHLLRLLPDGVLHRYQSKITLRSGARVHFGVAENWEKFLGLHFDACVSQTEAMGVDFAECRRMVARLRAKRGVLVV